MAAKTYIPTLVRVLRRTCQYITKYRPTLEKAIRDVAGEPGVTALNGVMTACEIFTELVTIAENP